MFSRLKKSKEVSMVLFFSGLGLFVLRVLVAIVGGTIAARYLWKECFLYFKNEEKSLPWALAALFGLFLGFALMIAAVVAWIFLQIEGKKSQPEAQKES